MIKKWPNASKNGKMSGQQDHAGHLARSKRDCWNEENLKITASIEFSEWPLEMSGEAMH